MPFQHIVHFIKGNTIFYVKFSYFEYSSYHTLLP